MNIMNLMLQNFNNIQIVRQLLVKSSRSDYYFQLVQIIKIIDNTVDNTVLYSKEI